MLKKLLDLLPKNQIADECHDGAGLLMTRYYLTPKIFGCRLVIHQFHRSDNDRHYHDHPWNFISFILKGSYIEHVPVEQFKNIDWAFEDNRFLSDIQICHRRFSIIKRPKTWKHWVELPEECEICKFKPEHVGPHVEFFIKCWTLVFLYGKRREWGFWTKEGWIKHDQYDCRGYTNGGDKLPSTKKSNPPTN